MAIKRYKRSSKRTCKRNRNRTRICKYRYTRKNKQRGGWPGASPAMPM